jgi:hypothetical protein
MYANEPSACSLRTVSAFEGAIRNVSSMHSLNGSETWPGCELASCLSPLTRRSRNRVIQPGQAGTQDPGSLRQTRATFALARLRNLRQQPNGTLEHVKVRRQPPLHAGQALVIPFVLCHA